MAGLIKRRPAQSDDIDIDALLAEPEPQSAKPAQPQPSAADAEIDALLAAPEPPLAAAQGELGAMDRAKLGFLSNASERQKFLSQKYPGARFGSQGSEEIVLLPGETTPRFIDDPNLTMTDIADLAGDIPGVVSGAAGGIAGMGALSIPAAATGAAAGEMARKAIGRGLILGEDVYQPEQIGEDLTDVGISAGAGALGQWGSNLVKGFISNRASKKALANIGNAGKKTLANQVIGGAGESAGSTVGGQAAAARAGRAAQGEIRGELQAIPDSATEAVRKNIPAPSTMKEVVDQYEKNLAANQVPDLPSRARLDEVLRMLPDIENKPIAPHYEMLKDRQSYDVLRTVYRDIPGKERQALDAYDARMKREIEGKVSEMIDTLGNRPKLAKTDAGNQLMSDVSEIYQANKKTIGPLFQEFHKVPINPQEHVEGLIERLSELAPGFGKAITKNPDNGKLVVKAFDPKWGVSRKAYSEMGSVVQSLNDGSLSFREMQHIREFLRKEIDPRNPGATQDLQNIRSAMLAHMEDLIEAHSPNLKVRDTFRKWAQNERFLEDFEEILGGKVETFNQLYRANPDAVISKVFHNPNTVEKSKALLGPEKFNNLVGDFLNDLREKAFNSANNQMSMARFASELRKKRGVIESALGKPGYERLMALADLGRIVPDMPPVNPSGTAKTGKIMGALKGVGNMALRSATGGAIDLGSTAEGIAKAAQSSEKDALKYLNNLFKEATEADRKRIADKLLPLVTSRNGRAALNLFMQGGSHSMLRGPRREGLIGQPQIRGPEQ